MILEYTFLFFSCRLMSVLKTSLEITRFLPKRLNLYTAALRANINKEPNPGSSLFTLVISADLLVQQYSDMACRVRVLRSERGIFNKYLSTLSGDPINLVLQFFPI